MYHIISINGGFKKYPTRGFLKFTENKYFLRQPFSHIIRYYLYTFQIRNVSYNI